MLLRTGPIMGRRNHLNAWSWITGIKKVYRLRNTTYLAQAESCWFMLSHFQSSWVILVILDHVVSCWVVLSHVKSCWVVLSLLESCSVKLSNVDSCWVLLIHVESCWFMLSLVDSCWVTWWGTWPGSCWPPPCTRSDIAPTSSHPPLALHWPSPEWPQCSR